MPARTLRGRAAELRTATTLLTRVRRTGQSAMLVISGEPGIGKTALAERIMADAITRGYITGSGKAEESDQIAPGAPLLSALRSGAKPVLPEDAFLALAPYSDQPLWLVDRLADALERRASEAPLLIHLDDVQWADPLTVFALRLLPGRLSGSPVAWLLSTRAESGPVEEVLAATPDTPVERISLRPLPPEALAQMTLDLLGQPASPDTSRLLEGADGNPFLVIELLEGLLTEPVGALPASLVLRIRERLRRLPEPTLRLLEVGAVLGRAFRVEDAAALLGGPALSAITPAVRESIIEDDGNRLSFRHDLLRQAIYEDLPASVRRAMHRAAAEHLLARGASALEAAPHVLVGAEVGDLAAARLLQSAALSGGSLLPEAAADLMRRAFSLVRPGDEAWVGIGLEAISMLGEAGRGSEALEIADVLLSAALPDDVVAEVQDRVSRPLWESGRLVALGRRAEIGLALPGLSSVARARLLGRRALAVSREELEVASAAGQAALALAESVGDANALVTAHQALGETARNHGRNAQALEHFQAVRELTFGAYLPDEILSLQLLDRYDEAGELLDQLDGMRGPAYHFARMWQDFNLGDLDAAEADARTVLHLGDELKRLTYHNEARVILARILQLRGEYEASSAQLAQVDAPLESDGESDDAGRAFIQRFMGVHLASAVGDVEGGLRTIRAMLAPEGFAWHRWLWQPVWFLDVVHLAVTARDHALAHETAATAAHLAGLSPGVASNLGVATLTRGLADGDLATLAAGAEILQTSPRPLLAGTGSLELGRALLAHGQRERGVAALEQSEQTFSLMGAFGPARAAREALLGSGVRRSRWTTPHPRPVSGWGALTPTEQRVARLIAAGHTNRSAAAELVLSPNTIATHVRSIFQKLDVRSRVQLSLAVRDLP